MRFRKLRIVWSVFWGMVCVLLIVLWVRSYLTTDDILGDTGGSEYTQFVTQEGTFIIEYPSDLRSIRKFKWKYMQLPVGSFGHQKSWFPRYYAGPAEQLVIPMWTIEVFICGLALLPWLPRRFSLRTLLIATTLVAVVLGLIVWLGS
jgi:hypothetical protein